VAERNDEELMRYLDGDLTPSEARQLERRLAEGGELGAMTESLGQVTDALRAHYEAKAEDAAPHMKDMWARLEKQLDRDHAPARRSVWQSIAEWFESYRGHVLTGAVSAAAGAIIAIVALRGAHPTVTSKPVAPIEAARGAEVESLDVTDGTGTIMKVPSDEGSSTVIWVTHTSSEEEGNEGPI
jgi:anti-sigma factor RsiW